MNRCVLKTFSKKMGIGALKVTLSILGCVAVFALLILILYGIGERGAMIVGQVFELTCLSAVVVVVPLAIGGATLMALQDSYDECGR